MSRARPATTGSTSTPRAADGRRRRAAAARVKLAAASARLGDDADRRRRRRHRDARPQDRRARLRRRRSTSRSASSPARPTLSPHRPAAAAGASATISDDLLADFVPGTGSVVGRGLAVRRASTRRRCCRRSTAIPTAARSRRSAARCRCSTSTSSPRSSIWRSTPISTGASTSAIEREMSAAEFERRLRPVGGRQRQRRPLARRLRHRLPHPRARTRFRRAAAGLRPGARPSAQRGRQRGRPDEGAGEPLAYALYVLARNGRPVIGDLRYLADTKLDVFKHAAGARRRSPPRSPCSATARARRKVFAAALDALDAEQDDGFSRPDYGSTLRDGAGVLALVAEANLDAAKSPAIRSRARARRSSARATDAPTPARRRTTGWCSPPRRSPNIRRSSDASAVDGQPVKGALYRTWSGYALGPKLVTIGNAGQTPAQRRDHDFGRSARARARRPRRAMRSSARSTSSTETKIDLESLTQNERVVVVLKITESEARYASLLVVDRLPAGLEIDNPALFDSGSIDALLLAEAATSIPSTPNIATTASSPHSTASPASRAFFSRRLCRARRRAGPLRLSAGDGGRHVSPRPLRPHRLRRARGRERSR